MKKITGILFIATAVFLLSSSMKPMGEDFPRLAELKSTIKPLGEDFPRLAKLDSTIKPMGEDFPRLA